MMNDDNDSLEEIRELRDNADEIPNANKLLTGDRETAISDELSVTSINRVSQ